MNYKNYNVSYEKNGTAFINFEKVQTAEKILEKFEQGFFRRIFANPISSILRRN